MDMDCHKPTTCTKILPTCTFTQFYLNPLFQSLPSMATNLITKTREATLHSLYMPFTTFQHTITPHFPCRIALLEKQNSYTTFAQMHVFYLRVDKRVHMSKFSICMRRSTPSQCP
eukprot:c22463_g1_i1 orf=30-374(+)